MNTTPESIFEEVRDATRGAGTIRVAYLGRDPVTVRGTFSGRRYAFSADQRVRSVDIDDSRVLLRTRYFRRA